MNDKVGQYLKKGDSAGNFAPHVTVWTEYGVRSMLLALLKNKEDELERTREACRNVLESRLATLRTENARLQDHLSNLLAVIHRDGGQYESIHGAEKAVADALDRIVVKRAELEAAVAECNTRRENLELMTKRLIAAENECEAGVLLHNAFEYEAETEWQQNALDNYQQARAARLGGAK